MLFDGAAVVTADAPAPADAMSPADAHPPVHRDDGAALPVSVVAATVEAASAASPGPTLLVIDPQVAQWQALVQDLAPDTRVLVLGADADPLGQIAAALDGERDYASIQVISHGASDGRLLLGSHTLDAGTLARHADELGRIGAALRADGDILLYGCDIADTAEGMRFLQTLADATGADVAASSDDTGAARLGGNWSLESRVGDIEATPAIPATAREAWDHLLAPGPSVSLSVPTGTTLVGETFTVTATFTNGGSDTGYAPYIDLFVPARGADGGAAPDGLTVDSASYLGAELTRTTITLTAGDIASGQVQHPYFTDTGGQHRVTIPAGVVAGDQLVVIQLPFGSFTPGQPAVAVTITGTLSALADVGTPLSMIARGGFRYGADPIDNPATDPSLQGATAAAAIDPGFYRLTTTYIGPENETATGPNYLRAYRIDLDVAAGQTVSGIDLSSILSPGMQFTPLTGTPASIGGLSPGSAPAGGWSNVDGVLLSGAGTSIATPATTMPGGTVTRLLSSPVTGTASRTDASMVVAFHVPELDASGTPVIDPVSGDAVVLTVGSAAHASWTPADQRDAAQAIAETVAAAHQLTARSIAVQKGESIAVDVGTGGLSAGDTLRFTLDVQVSDFFAFGYDAGSTPDLLLDTLSDGLTMLDASTTPAAADPTFTVDVAGGSTTVSLQRDVHYTVSLDAQGREQFVLGFAGHVLAGDLFGEALQQGATTVRVSYDAQVLEEFRITANDAAGNPVPITVQPAVNDGDHIANRVTVQGTVLDARLDPTLPGLQTEADDSAVVDTIAPDPVAIVLTSINGAAPTTPARASPGDEVTYLIRYVVGSGDFENLDLSAYLPKPVFSTSDPDVDGTPNPFTTAGGAWDASPAVGQYSVRATGGDGSGLATPPTVGADAGTNSLTFHLGHREDATNLPLTIEIAFTVRVSTDPFADELQLTAQSFGNSQNTAVTPSNSAAIVQLTLAEPLLRLFKGAVGDDVIEASSVFDPAYSISNPGSRIRPAGDTSANPLLGTVTPADVALLDNDIEDVDAGDTVRFAMMIVNDGTSARGAFDVELRDQLPGNIDPASVTNLRIVRGDGTALAYTRLDGAPATAADLFGTGIRLIDDPGADGLHGTGDDRGAIAGSLDAAGHPVTDGSNVVLVIYDATVRSDAAAGTMAGSRGRVLYYTGSPGGPSFVDPLPDGLYDDMAVATPLPLADKLIVGTDRDDTITAGNNVVIGERVTYEVVLTVPEGTTSNAQFVDTLDPGLSFVSVDSIVASSGLSFGSGLPAPGSIVPTSAGGDTNRITLPFGTITNGNSNNAQAETLTIRYTVVVDNVAANQQGALRNNAARLSFDTGGPLVVRTTVGDAAPDVRIVEPAMTVSLTPSALQPDAGDLVTFTLTLTSVAGSPPAFDVTLDVPSLTPAGFVYETGSLTQVSGPAADTLSFAGSSITGGWARLDGGQQVVLTFQARVGEAVTVDNAFGQTATARFSSLPGAGNTDLSPLAPPSAGDFERTGNAADPGGALNDYVATGSSTVRIATQTPVLTLVATSEPSTGGTSVAVGEILRYRMVVHLPESSPTDVRLTPALPAGLRFLNDGTATIAFVADGGAGGIDSSTLSGAGLDQAGGGNAAADITGITPVLALPSSAITDAAGTPLAAGAAPSGTSPVFRLGDLTNTDRDANKEFVVVEFDAIVENQAGNVNAATRQVSFGFRSDGALRATSNSVTTTVVEPKLDNFDKHVHSVAGDVVTWEVTFTNNGTETAHDLLLVDDFTGAVNQSFDGAAGVSIVSAPVGTTNASNASGLVIDIPALAVGSSVTVRYTSTVTDPRLVVPSRAAQIVWTSLTEGIGGGKTLSVSTTAGTAVSTTTGERTGHTADHGGASNTYSRSDGAGLGVFSGTLWDDTGSFNGAIDTGDPRLAGITVQAIWAGPDNVFSGADPVLTTTTQADGTFSFGMMPAGSIRVLAPAATTDATVGSVKVYRDVGSGSQTDGLIEFTLADAATATGRNFGYLQINDPPVVTVGGARSATEDTAMAFTGADTVSVADPDAGTTSTNTVTLSVLRGNLTVSAAGAVAVTGNGGTSVVLTGSIADINATLASLSYLNTLDYNGSDTLTVRADDHGNTGDANGDNVPNQPAGDNLTHTRTVAITVVGVNDPPVAVDDARTTNQNTAVSGQVLTPDATQITAGDRTDTDPDLPYGDTLSVQGVQAGSIAGPLTGNVGTTVDGTFGMLTLAANGSYTWTPGAQARTLPAGANGTDVFTYTIRDTAGATSTARITITVNGLNDAVGAQPDARSTTEDAPPITGNAVRGDGVAGGQPGDVADPDPDTGDLLTVRGVAAGSAGGPLSGNVGSAVSGSHGALTLNADGTYSYATDARAQALRAGQTAQDVFSYTVRDIAGTTATTTITITLTGQNDPVGAQPDARTTNEDAVQITGNAVTGNGVAGGQPGDVADPDIDVGDTLSVQGVAAGSSATVLTGNVGTAVTGAHGALTLAADGRYTYVLDPALQALAAGQSVQDVFSYTVRDAAGTTATTTITITINGANDAPVAQPDVRGTTEDAPPIGGNALRGDGIGGGAPGDVADTDIDAGDTLSVQGVQAGAVSGPLTGGLGAPVTGSYGALTLAADGSYSYATDARAQPLMAGQTVQDVFSYTIRDAAGATATTTITITLTGEDDDVQANPDVRTIPEPVGAVVPLTGNAITGGAAGEAADVTADPVPITVAGVTAGTRSGPLTAGTGSSILGDRGTLVLNADGSYSYTPDARAQTIPLGTTAPDVFSYTVTIPNGSTSTTTLTIDIVGDDDSPVAHPDVNRIPADATAPASGNVIGGAAGDGGSAADVADSDIDDGDVLTVAGVGPGSAGGPLAGAVGVPVTGAHGTLLLDADGRYRYTVDGADAAVIALAPGQTLTDTFGYTIDDGHGGQATTTLTITIDGRNDPPAGQDRTIALTEDTPVALAPADFGFSDPDAGAVFTAVRIDSLPASGTLLLNGVPVTAGQVVPFASIGQLSYQPAHDANRDNLAAPPSFRFSVRDEHGAFDPQPNTIGFAITPANDPPTAPRIAVTIEGSATEGSPTSAIGAVPAPTDPDVPAQTLTVRIDAVPGPLAGRFVLPDGRTLAPGMVLAPGELQQLSFVPNPDNPAPAGTDGLIDAGALRLTVSDGNGGAAEGEIAVRVRPMGGGDPVPPLRGPQLPPPPSGITGPGTTTTPATPLSAALDAMSQVPAGSEAGGGTRRLEPVTASEFDPSMPWAITPPAARNADDPRSDPVAEPAAKSSRVRPTVQQADADTDSGDCLPQLKPKVRPKAVARQVFEQKLRQAQPFSEQLKAERQRLRPPVRLPVRQPAARVC